MKKFVPTPAEARELDWLAEQKKEIDTTTGKPITWEKLAGYVGIPVGTLTPAMTRNYGAPYTKIANQIRLYRLQQEGKALRKRGVIRHPGMVDLPTSRRILSLMEKASDGKVVLICSESGYSKTYIANYFRQYGGAQVHMVTLDETSGGLTAMVSKVLKTLLKGKEPRGSRFFQSREVIRLLTGAKATLLIDEAGTLSTPAVEQIRHWQDETRCGIVLMGNRDLHTKISGGRPTQAYARLNSRIDYRLPLDIDLSEDIPLYLDAYQIEDEEIRHVLTRIGTNRLCGGLRDIDKTLMAASEFAAQDDTEVTMDHLVAGLQLRGLRMDGSAL
jgi:DNA transposition AAA+ family ATPase